MSVFYRCTPHAKTGADICPPHFVVKIFRFLGSYDLFAIRVRSAMIIGVRRL